MPGGWGNYPHYPSLAPAPAVLVLVGVCTLHYIRESFRKNPQTRQLLFLIVGTHSALFFIYVAIGALVMN